ncbi:hypothetical protein LMH87_001633 [Akanthomyces muscarius]|uniref:Uncharacterized protein n=1 Tax=Akanthomyces muscarius TaxID=2231603 RepID=A0A9W8UHR4_AKAMU|nr:hypothetical protein LMH87_001633 [Akanthomyces muscarius]KAJ4147085.1 hypothetical protein LMH87_001633 [Akanthomyces muscarius]
MLPFNQAKNKLGDIIVQFDRFSVALQGVKRTYSEEQLGQLISGIHELEHKAGDCLSLLRSNKLKGGELRVLNMRADELLQERVKPAVRHILAGSLDQVLRDNMLAIFRGKLPENQWQCTTVELQRRVKLCEELRDSPSTVIAWSATFPVEEWPKMDSAIFFALLERVEREVFVKRLSDQICVILTDLGQEAPLNESQHFISFFMFRGHQGGNCLPRFTDGRAVATWKALAALEHLARHDGSHD